MTYIERMMEIELRAERDDEEYMAETEQKIVEQYCPGSFFDYAPSVRPNKTQERCVTPMAKCMTPKAGCKACWDKEYKEVATN